MLLGFNVTNIFVDTNTAPKAITSKTTLLGLPPFTGLTITYKDANVSALCGIDILTLRRAPYGLTGKAHG